MKKLPIALLALVFFASCKNYGTKLSFKKGELYYTKQANEAEAKKLGSYLEEIGFFSDDKKISAQLDKRNDTSLFRFVTIDSFLTKPDYEQLVLQLIPELETKVFDNKPVVVELTDDGFNTKKTIRKSPVAATE